MRLVGQRSHTDGAERIRALTKLGDAHRLNELEQTLLHKTSILSVIGTKYREEWGDR